VYSRDLDTLRPTKDKGRTLFAFQRPQCPYTGFPIQARLRVETASLWCCDIIVARIIYSENILSTRLSHSDGSRSGYFIHGPSCASYYYWECSFTILLYAQDDDGARGEDNTIMVIIKIWRRWRWRGRRSRRGQGRLHEEHDLPTGQHSGALWLLFDDKRRVGRR